MTIVQDTAITAYRTVAFDLYRDIHKGIRAELFAVTSEAGRADASRRADRVALADHVRRVVQLLVTHAEHEDRGIQPALVAALPTFAAKIEADHIALDVRLAGLQTMADETVAAPAGVPRSELQHLYVELASFTSAYLEHQDLEERVVMPKLEEMLGVDAVVGIHGAIIGAIPPQELAESLAIMLPAMNVDDRAELLGGMQAGAPAEVFEGVWGLAGSVLAPFDHEALARRLGLS